MNLAAGNSNREAREYEKLMCEIARYLFGDYLGLWEEQEQSGDNLNRLDILCKIENRSGFWSFISHDLQSQYVVFECKNLCDFVGQSHILTTEKYLYGNAFRRFAIIFSRQGPNENALKMARGAMRENGKLIIVLKDADVIEMIESKIAGNNPSEDLASIVDNFFIDLGR